MSHRVEQYRELVNRRLQLYLSHRFPNLEGQNPLFPAVSYAASGPGKRVRASLVCAVNHSLGGSLDRAMLPAICCELLHTYSLVHDDLPCLDNDSLRRGRATTHIEFGEATALLAGDALLSEAFELLSNPEVGGFSPNFSNEELLHLIRILARASGAHGMVAGQTLDVYWSNRKSATVDDLTQVHTLKTGLLLGASTAMGAVCGYATRQQVESWFEFGTLIGIAFQIRDDLLDKQPGTGKSVGKDEDLGKLTYVSLLGEQAAKKLASDYTERALGLMRSLCSDHDDLGLYVSSLLNRLT